jgi:Tol biopolymer transport system component
MEYLEGETLAARLARGPLPPEEVFEYGIEIAEALDKAHAHGVVHRDLKPGNVMLTRTGMKLLDFGLARAPMEQLFSSETRPPGSAPVTAEGVLVGTLQYMAPEQLEGRPVDARTDIFALGVLLYEMATGERAFAGESQASIIAAILHHTPPAPSTRQPLTPRALDHIVWRCLPKNPDERWQTARDVALELRTRQHEDVPIAKPASPTFPPVGWLLAGLVLLAVVAGSLLSGWLSPRPTQATAIRALVSPPAQLLFQLTGDYAGPPAIAPDGRSIVFTAVDRVGKRQLWLRRLDSLVPEPLPATEDGTFPFWAPDSHAIGFFAGGKLKRLNLDAGSSLALCDAVGGRGGSWANDGTILFAPGVRGGLHRVSASGGTPQPVTTTDGTPYVSHRWPQVLPDGRHFLFLAVQQQEGRDQSAVFLGSLSGQKPQEILQASGQALFADGNLLFIRERTLWAQPFNPDSAALDGAPTAVAQDVLFDPTIWRGIFDASPSGPLIYQSGQAGTALTLYDRTGRELGVIGEQGIIFDVNLSPDGRHVAVNRGEPADIWVYELTRGTSLRLTFDARNEILPVWASDGRSLIYSRVELDGKIAVMQIPASGGEPKTLLPPDDLMVTDWSSDGRYLLLRQGALIMSPGDVYVAPPDDLAHARPILQTPFAEYHARFSPDHRWVSYVSNESGRDEVYVMPFSPPTSDTPAAVTGRVRISTAGGVLPRWRGNGRELFYLSPDMRLMAATLVPSAAGLAVTHVTPLFSLNPKPVGWVYDVMPDGERFIVNSLGDEGRRPLVLVTGWAPAAPGATR